MATPIIPDYIALLTANMEASKNEIQTKFELIKENLDLQEKNIIDQIDGIFSENMKTIKELQTFRAQTLESKESISKASQDASLLQSLSHNIDSTLENLSSQIENLTSIKFSWNIPDNLWENLISIDETGKTLDKDQVPTKIVKDVCQGKTNGKLSRNLKDMRIYEEKIYVSDKSANAIKIFRRSGQYLDSYTNARLLSPGSMTIHKHNLYVLTDQNTDADDHLTRYPESILLFRISTRNLETIFILQINSSYGVIDTNGKCLYLLQGERYDGLSKQRLKFESWNFSLKFRENALRLYRDKYIPSSRDSKLKTRYQQNKNLVLFYDIKLHNTEIFILFSNSIYLFQSFDLNGNRLRAILEEDLTRNIVGMTLMQQENDVIILRDETNSQILIFSNQEKLIRTIESADTPYGLKSPMCMDIDERGNLVVCDGKDNWMLQDIPI
ncbi:hypothetical protein LOD99_5697 [Oopsacas minuta]|uniref:Uncharacterized protein n=1 Tax=Oopsacas minuta TaxID=111878 RepID=A0AAV7JPV0_9METZ|nr:hypothetical protein LOD99_5697 [Oopsacas minuta]